MKRLSLVVIIFVFGFSLGWLNKVPWTSVDFLSSPVTTPPGNQQPAVTDVDVNHHPSPHSNPPVVDLSVVDALTLPVGDNVKSTPIASSVVREISVARLIEHLSNHRYQEAVALYQQLDQSTDLADKQN